MPVQVVGLLFLFILVAVVCGVIAVALIGPRRPLATVLPIAASFIALYLIGHRSGLSLGPTTIVFGFEVSLLWDVAAAATAALAVTAVQQAAIRR